MKFGKQIKIMFIVLTVSFAVRETVRAGDAGYTDVSARIVAEDSGQEDPPQGDETDGKPDGETDGTGETARVENTVRTGDALSAVILPICLTAMSGAMIILFLRVRRRHREA